GFESQTVIGSGGYGNNIAQTLRDSRLAAVVEQSIQVEAPCGDGAIRFERQVVKTSCCYSHNIAQSGRRSTLAVYIPTPSCDSAVRLKREAVIGACGY